MRAHEIITEAGIDRRGFLKGLGAAAASAALPTARAGQYQSWENWAKDPKTLDLWDQRFKKLSASVERVLARLKSKLTPEQRDKIGDVKVEVGDTRMGGIYSRKNHLITIDLSVFWDLGPDALGYTIAHELGHAYYGHGGYRTNTKEENYNNELLADAFGAKLAYSAGFDPKKCFADFSEEMKRAPGIDTHPSYRDRIRYIREQTGITVSHIMRGVQLLNVPMNQIAQMGSGNQNMAEAVPGKYLSGSEKVKNISPVLTKPYGSAKQTALMKNFFGSS